MLIERSTYSCALAYEGNNIRETLRSVFSAGDREWHSLDNEVVSPNISEPVSASLHNWRSVSLSDMVEPAIVGKVTFRSIRQGARGDWGERATTEHVRYLGEPSRCCNLTVGLQQRLQGNHNLHFLRRRQSDRFIVAMKQSNFCGAKGPDFYHVFTARGGAA